MTPHRLRPVINELWPIVALSAAFIIVLGAITTNIHSLELMFVDGDALVLPLFEKSVAAGEAFGWVFSSQMFFFPEMLLYGISGAFTDSVRATLTINAFLNILVVYALIRLIIGTASRRVTLISRAPTIAFGATLILLTVILLEQVGDTQRTVLAMPLLFTTYYIGVLISGLSVVAIVLWFIGRPAPGVSPWAPRRTGIYVLAVAAITLATTFSNPLYLMWVSAPLSCALIALVVLRRVGARDIVAHLAIHLVPAIAAMALRQVFAELTPISLGNYVKFDEIPNSINLFRELVVALVGTPAGAGRLAILLALLAFTFWRFGAVLARSRDATAPRPLGDELIAIFTGVSAISVLVGTVITGSTVFRYIEPLLVFTLLPLGLYVLRRIEESGRRAVPRWPRALAAALVIGVVATAAVVAPKTIDAVRHVAYDKTGCFDAFVGDDDINGVGSYWTTRTLEVYGKGRGDLLQVSIDFSPMAWMINLESYRDTTFSYAIVDDTPIFTIDAVNLLGTPSQVIDCGDYQIYDFRNTPGEALLTQYVADKVALSPRLH